MMAPAALSLASIIRRTKTRLPWGRVAWGGGTARQFQHHGNGAGVVVGPRRPHNRVVMGADNVRNGVHPGAGKIGDQVGNPPALVLVGLFADGEARRLKGPAHVILGLSEAIAAKYRAFADVPGQRPHVTTERHLEGIGVVADHRGEPENEGGEQGECQKHGMEGPSFHLT